MKFFRTVQESLFFGWPIGPTKCTPGQISLSKKILAECEGVLARLWYYCRKHGATGDPDP